MRSPVAVIGRFAFKFAQRARTGQQSVRSGALSRVDAGGFLNGARTQSSALNLTGRRNSFIRRP